MEQKVFTFEVIKGICSDIEVHFIQTMAKSSSAVIIGDFHDSCIFPCGWKKTLICLYFTKEQSLHLANSLRCFFNQHRTSSLLAHSANVKPSGTFSTRFKLAGVGEFPYG